MSFDFLFHETPPLRNRRLCAELALREAAVEKTTTARTTAKSTRSSGRRCMPWSRPSSSRTSSWSPLRRRRLVAQTLPELADRPWACAGAAFRWDTGAGRLWRHHNVGRVGGREISCGAGFAFSCLRAAPVQIVGGRYLFGARSSRGVLNSGSVFTAHPLSKTSRPRLCGYIPEAQFVSATAPRGAYCAADELCHWAQQTAAIARGLACCLSGPPGPRFSCVPHHQ